MENSPYSLMECSSIPRPSIMFLKERNDMENIPLLDFDQFKLLHSEALMHYQIIEHDLKLIYAYMHSGEVLDNLRRIDGKTMGQMIEALKKLDNSDGNPHISHYDYNFLRQISWNRNHWAHQVYLEFVYEEDFIHSEQYERQCRRLMKDHERLLSVSRRLEELRITFCNETCKR